MRSTNIDNYFGVYDYKPIGNLETANNPEISSDKF